MTDDALVEESFEIAWTVLERSGELGDREQAAKLSDPQDYQYGRQR